MQTVKTLIVGLLIGAGIVRAEAQVTIGSTLDPVKGALLDLKSQAPDGDNVTSAIGGLGLPRVQLVSTTTLEPFIATGSTEWQAQEAKTRLDYIGLLVYNLTDNADFKPGTYVWRGAGWEPLKLTSGCIQLPSFNLPWVTSPSTINLFEMYKLNFAPATTATYRSSAGAGIVTHFPAYDAAAEAADFDYAITYYDPAVYDITSIGTDGVMTYTCLGASPTAGKDTYINVVIIKR